MVDCQSRGLFRVYIGLRGGGDERLEEERYGEVEHFVAEDNSRRRCIHMMWWNESHCESKFKDCGRRG